LSIIQGPFSFSVAPCQTLISRFATFFIGVGEFAAAASLRTALSPPLASAVLGVRAAEWALHQRHEAEEGRPRPGGLWTRF
jgi:hypothetical protein